MAKAKRAGKSYQGYYANYKSSSRWKTNRERRLKKLLESQPDNEQIKLAIKNISYRRKNPNTNNVWSKTNIRVAQLFKQFCGKAPHELFSSNTKVQQEALSLRSNVTKSPTGRVDFSLAARAHDKWGRLVWA